MPPHVLDRCYALGSDDDVAVVGGDGQATDGIVDCVLSLQFISAVAAQTHSYNYYLEARRCIYRHGSRSHAIPTCLAALVSWP